MAKSKTKTNGELIKVYEEYRSCSHVDRVLTNKFVEKLGLELQQYARDSDGTKDFILFLDGYGIPYRTFTKWIHKYPELAKDYDQAKAIVAQKRQEKAFAKIIDASLAKFTLFHYHPDYAGIQRLVTQLGDQMEALQQKIVLIENITELKKLEDNGTV